MSFPTPFELGMPEKFSSWFPNQAEAALEIDACDLPYITQVNGTGSGKTLIYTSAAYMSGSRVVILTSTKGLQSQLLNDFRSVGLVDIRGKNSYKCRLEHDGSTCDHGPCIAGYNCAYKSSGCSYFDTLRLAKNAQIVSTNYSYWMHVNKYSLGLGDFDMMVCDEAHNLPDLISDFLTVTISLRNPHIESLLPFDYKKFTVGDWVNWAHEIEPKVESNIEGLKFEIRSGQDSKDKRKFLSQMAALANSLKMLKRMDDNWILDYSNPERIQFAPTWPKRYSKEALFYDIPKVVLTSATVNRKTLDMVGISSDEAVYTEYPHLFPSANRRLIHAKTIRLNRHTSAEQMKVWLSKIDTILSRRLDRKGLIHTVSYARRNEILNYTHYRDFMITHETKTAIQAIQSFKYADPPAFLVSPAMTTGFDFPGDECRFQIIGKISWPDRRNKITDARCKQDKDYGGYIAAQHLVQAVGRGMRSMDDWVENIIIDDSVTWFMKQYARFMPKWFTEAYVSMRTVPEPPKLS
jgi:ATP-dependent DNA helicase DinG